MVLSAYHYLIQPVHIDKPLACYGMLLMAWFSGCCIGLIFLSFRPWWPEGSQVLTSFYQRMNMIFSGKMFVANTLPLYGEPIASPSDPGPEGPVGHLATECERDRRTQCAFWRCHSPVPHREWHGPSGSTPRRPPQP